jgi:hypothetical protein
MATHPPDVFDRPIPDCVGGGTADFFLALHLVIGEIMSKLLKTLADEPEGFIGSRVLSKELKPHYTEFLSSADVIGRLYKHFFGFKAMVVCEAALVKRLQEGRSEKVRGLLSSDSGRRQLLKEIHP